MPKKRRARRFLITVEIEEVDADQKPDEISHQVPPKLQVRDDQPGWLERQEVPPRRRRRPRSSEG